MTTLLFGHIIRTKDSLEKVILLQKVEGCRNRRKLTMKLIDSLKEVIAFNCQNLSKPVNDGTFIGH